MCSTVCCGCLVRVRSGANCPLGIPRIKRAIGDFKQTNLRMYWEGIQGVAKI